VNAAFASTSVEAHALPRARISECLERVFSNAERQEWRGADKHDGLNSPLLHALFGWSKTTRLVAIQAVMRAPVDLRGILRVKRVYNPKGLALFVLACLDRHTATGAPIHLQRAERLIEILDAVRSAQGAWGYQYPWQDPGFFAPAGTPNAVVTAFVCEALIAAYRKLGRSSLLDRVTAAIEFFLRDLRRLKDEPDELCFSYMPLDMRMRVMDVSILIASVIAQHAQLTGRHDHMSTAQRLATYVARQQTAYGAWYYTDPSTASRIRHDNYHTGFILDAFTRYMDASGDRRWITVYQSGLQFYANTLFESDGAPRWMSDQSFPHDIHGAAQGILTFAQHRAGYPGLAEKIALWALDRMYDPEGCFFYQRTRWYTKRFTLLRWCNAWMARGLAALEKEMSA